MPLVRVLAMLGWTVARLAREVPMLLVALLVFLAALRTVGLVLASPYPPLFTAVLALAFSAAFARVRRSS